MTRVVFEVLKVPMGSWDEDEFSARGVYPTGERMGPVHRTKSSAEQQREHLQENSPSERFGESMDDAPYRFIISSREVVD